MKYADLSFESYAHGTIIADYSDDDNVRYCGRSFDWRKQPLINDPFQTITEAETKAREYILKESE